VILKQDQISDRFGVGRGVFGNGKGHAWIVGNDSVLHTRDSGVTWEEQISSDNLPGNRNSIFLSRGVANGEGKAFIVGQSGGGMVLGSDDSGRNWKVKLESESANFFKDVSFWSLGEGCVLAGTTELYCTSDNGASWVKRSITIPLRENDFPIRLVLATRDRGWLATAGGFLYETLDGGHTWQEGSAAKLTCP
jgi:photosystem II stability/assembly factor-like uncharacterized protein